MSMINRAIESVKSFFDPPVLEGTIDIIRTSASRPELFKASTESLIEGLRYSGKLRWMMHENYLNKSASEQVIRYAKESGLYEVVIESNPSVGQCMGLTKLLRQVRTKYLFNYEDDWEILRPIDLDVASKIMDENPGVNQIAFHKRDTMRECSGLKKAEVVRSGHKLVTSPHWRLTPALWRTSYIRPRWVATESSNFIWTLNDRLRGANKAPNADWIIRNTGTFYMGGFDEKKFVRHLGVNQSVRLNECTWA